MQKEILLSELKHSPNNVRQVKSSDASIDQLAASIKSKGLLHNLVVVKNGTGYNVIDGNRRLEALNKIYNSKSTPVNCIVIESEDNEVGLHANMMRENMHPLDECDAINALVMDGSEDYDSVAARFGQTQKWVHQRVMLSELSDKAKGLFRANEFGIGVAQALTLGNHAKQDEYFDTFDHYNVDSIRRFMTSKKLPLSAALFEITDDARKELAVESDLFSDNEYITDLQAFDVWQKTFIHNRIDELKKKYFDVIYLVDEYSYASHETRGLTRIYSFDEKERDTADVVCVLVYNSYQHALTEEYMLPSETVEAEKAEDSEEEEVEVNPMVMSKPQEQLLKSYHAEYVRNDIWKWVHAEDTTRFFKALLCHRSLGYSYSLTNRVGHLYAENQNVFPKDDIPDDYITPQYEALISKHIDSASSAFEDNGTTPLSYCLSLSDEELHKFFIACCITALSPNDLRSKTIMDVSPFKAPDNGWFKPDAKWVNKWKAEQLSQMEDYLFGKVSSASRSQRVNAIVKELKDNPVFDPFGSWPQYK